MIAEAIHESVEFIRQNSSLKPKLGIILGSGLGKFAENISSGWTASYADIPGFFETSVESHKGRLVMGIVKDTPVAILQGRVHYYEGYNMTQVVHGTRTLAMLGIEGLIITNAAGALDKNFKPGEFMLINDHINLMGDNPLRGKNMDQVGPRFPDMTEAYDKTFGEIAKKCAARKGIKLQEGVYVGLQGPTYETPAEVRYLQFIGGNAVGMSTVPEVIAANHMGVRVCGISCLTNLAAGITGDKLSHEEVQATGRKVEDTFKEFLVDLIPGIAEHLSHESSK